MKPTAPDKSKLQWLFSHEISRKHPVRTILRLIKWEMIRMLNISIRQRYDDQFGIVLFPNEGASRLTYYFGISEPELFQVYNDFLKPGMIVVDAGANIGLHTLYFSRRVGDRGKVYAFEPAKFIYDRLTQHVRTNCCTNVECLCCALGAVPGTVELVENAADTSRTFVRASTSSSSKGLGVPVETLDAFASSRNILEIDFLKLDVEGFESKIFAGARDLLTRRSIKVIQVELDPRSLGRAGSRKSDVLLMLQNRKYSLCRWNRIEKRFEPTIEEGYNSFFIRQEMLRHHPNAPTDF